MSKHVSEMSAEELEVHIEDQKKKASEHLKALRALLKVVKTKPQAVGA